MAGITEERVRELIVEALAERDRRNAERAARLAEDVRRLREDVRVARSAVEVTFNPLDDGEPVKVKAPAKHDPRAPYRTEAVVCPDLGTVIIRDSFNSAVVLKWPIPPSDVQGER